MADRLCPECGYDLRSHIGSVVRCPECGGVFADTQIEIEGLWRSYLRPFLAKWTWMLGVAAIALPLIWLGIFWLGYTLFDTHRWPDWYAGMFQLFPLPALAGQMVLAYACGRWLPRRWPWWGCLLEAITVLVLSAAVFAIMMLMILDFILRNV